MLSLIAQFSEANLLSVEGLEWLAESTRQILGAGAGALLLLEEGKGELVVKKDGEEHPAWRYEIELDWDGGLIEGCLHEKQTLRLNEASADPRVVSLEHLVGLPIRSMLCAPLVLGDLVMGAILVFNRLQGSFQPGDQELLAQFASVVAQKFQDARLIQQLKVTNAELEAGHWQIVRSRNTLRALFDNIPTSIYIIDQKYTLAAINMHRARRVNSPPNQLVGRLCYEALYGRSDVCRDCQVLETLFGGQHTSRNKRHWELEDEPQEWEISTYPIYDQANQVIQAIVHEQDVTEKRRLEATLAQSEKLAAVGQLAAGLAHEINNPLTAIIANAQMLQRELPPEDDRQELVDLIYRAGGRASKVVHNLLDLARKKQYDFKPTDLNETVNGALKLLQHEFVSRSLTLVWEPARPAAYHGQPGPAARGLINSP
jgi:two-component system NtrC family sensor kinase